MAKNNAIKKQQQIIEDDFDFPEMIDSSYDDEVMTGIMNGMVEASNNQMLLALDLTKLALDKNSKEMNEDEVFSIFNKASEVIYERYPLRKLMEKFETEN